MGQEQSGIIPNLAQKMSGHNDRQQLPCRFWGADTVGQGPGPFLPQGASP
jgi:hypothetical protein